MKNYLDNWENNKIYRNKFIGLSSKKQLLIPQSLSYRTFRMLSLLYFFTFINIKFSFRSCFIKF